MDKHRRARPGARLRGAVALASVVLAATGCSADPAARDAPSPPPSTASAALTSSPPPVSAAPSTNPPGGATTRSSGATTVTPMSRSAPVRLEIESIGLSTELMDLGLQDDGTMEVPPGAFPAGWYTGAPTPGELGPAIIAGHVQYDEPGVFADLEDVERGDEIVVTRANGSSAVFRVTRTEQFDKSEFPTDLVYGDIDHAGLRVITCDGLDAESGTYEENLVVFAELERART